MLNQLSIFKKWMSEDKIGLTLLFCSIIFYVAFVVLLSSANYEVTTPVFLFVMFDVMLINETIIKHVSWRTKSKLIAADSNWNMYEKLGRYALSVTVFSIFTVFFSGQYFGDIPTGAVVFLFAVPVFIFIYKIIGKRDLSKLPHNGVSTAKTNLVNLGSFKYHNKSVTFTSTVDEKELCVTYLEFDRQLEKKVFEDLCEARCFFQNKVDQVINHTSKTDVSLFLQQGIPW